MTKDQQISKIIFEQLDTIESKEKYLNLLNSRIDENRKTLSSLLVIMVLTAFAFPLIVETKISEISVGPFKLRDNLFAISKFPLFAYVSAVFFLSSMYFSWQRNNFSYVWVVNSSVKSFTSITSFF